MMDAATTQIYVHHNTLSSQILGWRDSPCRNESRGNTCPPTSTKSPCNLCCRGFWFWRI